jgi:hypothetical protein
MSRKGTNQKENSNFITRRGALLSAYRIFFMSGRRNLDLNQDVDLLNVRKYRREAFINLYNSPSKRKCQQSGAWILKGVQKEKKDIVIRTLIVSKSHLYSSRSCYHHVWLEELQGKKKDLQTRKPNGVNFLCHIKATFVAAGDVSWGYLYV